jgi:uncharacterized protein YecE (DUF72 family)
MCDHIVYKPFAGRYAAQLHCEAASRSTALPSGVGDILIGTASWTDKTLIDSGRFYPAAAKSAEARLRYYATQFPLVEIDSTYYALPAERTAQLWAERTPKHFTFDVKAFRLFTGHQAQPNALPADLRKAIEPTKQRQLYFRDLSDEVRGELWQRFRSGLAPLHHAGKLGAVLLQFAPWFIFGRESLDYLLQCAEMLAGHRVAVEFRNKSWFSEKTSQTTVRFERDNGLTHVVVDEPQGFTSSIPQVWETTSPALAILRLHGRNRETWTKKGLATSAERFNYLYSEEQLRTLADSARQLAGRARRLHVLFNNCHEDKAQRNAIQFGQILA